MVTRGERGDIDVAIYRGRASVEEDAVMTLLRTRFGKLWPAIEERLAASEDPVLLEQLLQRLQEAAPLPSPAGRRG